LNRRQFLLAAAALSATGPASAATTSQGLRLVAAARAQVGQTLHYDPAYVRLPYPGGDVPLDRGVCTDVIIRAFRALGVDLQVQVHEDMRRAFLSYPQLWGSNGPDHNIDHRRVPNLECFWTRRGIRLPAETGTMALRPGDLVTCTVPPHLPHVMVVSDRRAEGGPLLVIHNIGAGAQEEDRIGDFPIRAAFRPFADAP
jgi:uncharacterized protein YijF (DUF1287 family)